MEGEQDYLYEAEQHERIVELVRALYMQREGKVLEVRTVQAEDFDAIVVREKHIGIELEAEEDLEDDLLGLAFDADVQEILATKGT